MFFLIPILCPICWEKVFFFQTKNTYGVADNIEKNIDAHICPFIMGKQYWNTSNLKICFQTQKQKEQNFSTIFSRLNPPFFFRKTKKVPKKAVLLRYRQQEEYDKLFFSDLNFSAFSLLTKQKENWKAGSLFDIKLSKIVKKNQSIASHLQQDRDSKKICVEKINQKIFVMKIQGDDLSLLESAENILLQKLHTAPKASKKKNKVLAIYPQKCDWGFARKLVFFLNDSLEMFFYNLKLPQGVTFSLPQKEFSLQLENIAIKDLVNRSK